MRVKEKKLKEKSEYSSTYTKQYKVLILIVLTGLGLGTGCTVSFIRWWWMERCYCVDGHPSGKQMNSWHFKNFTTSLTDWQIKICQHFSVKYNQFYKLEMKWYINGMKDRSEKCHGNLKACFHFCINKYFIDVNKLTTNRINHFR